MKKSRAIFGILLPILALTLSACDFLPTDLFGGKGSSEQSSSRRIRSNNGSTSRSSYNNNHVHRFSDEWSSNSQYHWHDAVCGHDVKSEVAPHTIYSEVIKEATCQETGQRMDYCTVCGYEANIVIPKTNHKWSEYDRKEPTCTEPGYVKKFCTVCGVFGEEELPPIGHNLEEEIIQYRTCTESEIIRRRCKVCGYEEIIDNGCYGHEFAMIYRQESTCTEPGFERYQCQRCGLIEESYLQVSSHRWSGNETVVQGDSGVPYYLDNCIHCGLQRIALATTSGVINGSLKDSIATQYGYLKLANNGDSISLDFEYPNSAYVRIYQHAVSEKWSNGSYQFATYHSMNSASSSSGYNFSMQVNGQLVDLSTSSNYTYMDLLGTSSYQIDELTNNGFSPCADCLIGDAQLVPGMNNITYTRLGSYCLNIDYFVLVITNTSHTHSFAASLYADEQYHWRQCLDTNCPLAGGVVDKTEHGFFQDSVTYGNSCSDLAEVKYICGTCGYVKYEYQTFSHLYGGEPEYVTNNDGYQQVINHCQTCGKTVQAYDFSCGKVEQGAYQSGRLQQGTIMTWRFPVFKTGYVSLYLPMYVLSSSYLNQYFDPSLYTIKFNGNVADILLPYAAYQDIGVKLSEPAYLKFATYYVTDYDVATSEITVSLASGVSSYRPYFDGEIRLEY